MKISKTAVLVLGGIFATLWLGLMVVNAAEKTLTMDLKNAVQHFKTVRLITTSDNSGVELNRIDGPLVEISGANNFIITTGGTEESQINQILNVRNSSILGGKGNKINNGGGGGNYDVILGGEGNLMDGSDNFYNVILGGKGNQIHNSRQSVILGGEGNIINNSYYGTVIGNKNTLGGSYSVAIGYKNTLSSRDSAAVGSNGTVGGTRSFLWTNDTLSVGGGDVFVVNGENGMVVNANKAHSFAKLTVGGSLVIGTKDISAGEGGMIKVLNGTNGRKCFCSHNGSGRNSLHGGGSCAPICNGTQKNPKCAATADVTCNGKVFNVENGCEIGSVVAGTGAFFIDNGNYIHWACESENGNVTTSLNPSVDCKQKIPPDGQCGSSKPEAGCGGERGTCTKGDLYTEITKPDDENYWYWYCKYGAESIKECKAAKSKQSKSCSGKPANSYWVNDKFTQILDGGAWKPLNKTPTHSSDPSVECSFMCNEEGVKYKWDGSNCVLITFSCKNTKPTQNGGYIFTTKNPGSSSEEKNWTHITDGTAQTSLKACEFTCDKANGYTWNGSICYNSTTFSCKNTKPTQNGGYIFTTKNPGSSSEEKNWTHITDGTAQTSLKACEFTCDKANGYKWNGSICVSPTSSYTCAKTLANKYKCQSSDGTYVDGTTPSHANNEYMWFCNNGTTKCGICDDGTKAEPPHSGACVTTYECTSDDPIFDIAMQVNGPKDKNEGKKLYRTKEEAQNYNCSYICKSPYVFLPAGGGKGDRCVKCEKGTEEYDKSGNLIGCSEIIDVCDNPYVYDPVKRKCVVKNGRCITRGNDIIKASDFPAHALGSYDNILPPADNDLKEWSCVDNAGSVTPHTCTFACEKDYYCSDSFGYFSCLGISCRGGNTRNNAKYIANPTKVNDDWHYISTEAEFNNIDKDAAGCYYYCPTDRLCKGIYSTESYWECLASSDDWTQEKCEPSSFSCSGNRPANLLGETDYEYNAKSANQPRKEYNTIGGFAEHKSEGCVEGCNSTATHIKTYNGKTVCWRSCPSNQYFKYENGGGCKSCSMQWQKPNPDKSTWVLGNPIDCVNKCTDEQLWCEDCLSGSEGCIAIEVDPKSCPKGSTQIELPDGSLKCVYPIS